LYKILKYSDKNRVVLFEIASLDDSHGAVEIVVRQVSERKERSGCTLTKQYEIFLNRKSYWS
jgi:hypothetical protein